MIIVIQCAATKIRSAGTLVTRSGIPVTFVARPDLAPADGRLYAHPDDASDAGMTWREQLGHDDSAARCKLVAACDLYRRGEYRALAERFGRDRVFILSAGWGLVRADFPLPTYDITLSSNAEVPYIRRRPKDVYLDFMQLPRDGTSDIHFIGGADYLPHFLQLTDGTAARRFVHYNSRIAPTVPGCHAVRYETTARTGWHYLLARRFAETGETGFVAT